MGQVGADRCDDGNAEAPSGQAWYTLAASAGVENDHGCRPDEAIYRERRKPGGVAPDSPCERTSS
jgi:hypothetical protein